MKQERHGCKLGKGEQRLGTKISSTRGLSRFFCVNTHQALQLATRVEQQGYHRPENLNVKASGKLGLYFMKNRDDERICSDCDSTLGVLNPACLWGTAPTG